ncbi:DsrE family protein [Nocardioides sp. BP30]|uniref:DsrE family protein n=1 Tax=Nocardioides sp. BP30 TaxID=3036374 RepID=UPI0024694D18|nr:DsrE family protein [Nocardioides sp. BP30]WGL52416.1 DsrE family protein [Nocardioides sp. BP30]
MKTVAHIFHDDADSLIIGSRLPARVAEIAAHDDIGVEVFVFGPAQRHLTQVDTETDRVFNAQIDAVIAAGIPVGACINASRAEGTQTTLAQRGLKLSVARDEFIRFTLERATVITF